MRKLLLFISTSAIYTAWPVLVQIKQVIINKCIINLTFIKLYYDEH